MKLFKRFRKINPEQLKITKEEVEFLEENSPPEHKVEMYIYHLRQHGKRYAKRYAATAKISEELATFLPQCDPWRDHDNCSICCNYWDYKKGCRLIYED